MLSLQTAFQALGSGLATHNLLSHQAGYFLCQLINPLALLLQHHFRMA